PTTVPIHPREAPVVRHGFEATEMGIHAINGATRGYTAIRLVARPLRAVMHEPPKITLTELLIVGREDNEGVPTVIDLRGRGHDPFNGSKPEKTLHIREQQRSVVGRNAKVFSVACDDGVVIVGENLGQRPDERVGPCPAESLSVQNL